MYMYMGFFQKDNDIVFSVMTLIVMKCTRYADLIITCMQSLGSCVLKNSETTYVCMELVFFIVAGFSRQLCNAIYFESMGACLVAGHR